MSSPRSRVVQRWMRWFAGLGVAAVLVYMSYLSLQEGFSLSVPVIGGMLATIVLLMYGTTELAALIDAWRGGEE